MQKKLEKLKEEKAITITSLAIMIIILLIIASISITSGVSTVRYTKFVRAKAQMETMQTQVNSWYQNNIEDYGTEITSGTYSDAFSGAGETDQDGYRLFSAEYLNGLGLEEIQYDYLINISKRKIILAEGIKYEGDMYYTPEDFGISNVEYVSNKSVSFDLNYEKDPSNSSEIYIYITNLKFYDESGNETNISKFKVEIKKDSQTYWEEKNVINAMYNNSEAYRITAESGTKYQVRVSANNGQIYQEKELIIEEE